MLGAMRRNRVLIAALVVVAGLVVLVTGGTWVYINVIEGDPPSKLTLEPGGAGPVSTTADGTASTDPASSGPVEGTWTVTAGSQAGYRVKETLFGQGTEAVGRTDKVTGSIVIAGTTVSSGSFTVDLTTVSSDRTQRDGQFRGRIMDTSTYPTAMFALTQPIDLATTGDAPAAAKATGELTLHGVTKTVTVAPQAQRTGSTIKVAGSIPVTFADYGISNPSGGPAQVGDTGEVEFLLVLAR